MPDQPHFVYVVGVEVPEDGGYEAYKIGSSATPARRLAMLQTGNHRTLDFVHLYRFRFREAAQYFERALQYECREYAVRGEWIAHPDLLELSDFIENRLESRLRKVEVQAVDLTGFVAMYRLNEELFGSFLKGGLLPELSVEQLDNVLRHEPGKAPRCGLD